jgi:hypothetical protein
MQQKPLQEVARLANIAISIGYPVEAQWNAETKIRLKKVEYDKDDQGEHLYGYDTENEKHCIGGATIRQYSPDAVSFFWNAKDGCSK